MEIFKFITGKTFLSTDATELQKSSMKQIDKVGIFGDEKIVAVAGTPKLLLAQEWPHILITNKRVVVFDQLNVHQYLYKQISNIALEGVNELPMITLNNGEKRDIFGTFLLGAVMKDLVRKVHMHLQEQWMNAQ